MNTRFLSIVIVAMLSCSACHTTPPHNWEDGAARELDTLQAMMTGSFSSEAQAAEDTDYRDIRLHMVPIWPAHTSRQQRWLYVEQAVSTSLEKPYRQRIYGVGATADGSFVSEVYELPGDPLVFAGAWKNPSQLDALSPGQLTRRDGCAVMLHRIRAKEPIFEGGTVGVGCASSLRGAAYATSKAHIDMFGLRTWDQGFDQSGVQVWGATKGPYVFLRQ